jgi:flagellar biosynthesis/type III secretory pathway protein FliH
MDIWKQECRAEGLAEGRAEGLAEGETKARSKMLKNILSTLSEKEAKALGYTDEEIAKGR